MLNYFPEQICPPARENSGCLAGVVRRTDGKEIDGWNLESGGKMEKEETKETQKEEPEISFCQLIPVPLLNVLL